MQNERMMYSDNMMCCLMLISRTGMMAGAYDQKSMCSMMRC